jgi:hypothetical protein
LGLRAALIAEAPWLWSRRLCKKHKYDSRYVKALASYV